MNDADRAQKRTDELRQRWRQAQEDADRMRRQYEDSLHIRQEAYEAFDAADRRAKKLQAQAGG